MNVYEKLQTCRVKLQGVEMKKSGKNTFAKYDYFELEDFLPHINKLFADHKLFSQVTFTSDMATLLIVNAEKSDEVITFTSPMASAQLKGCHEIQNLGAVQSYQRRYLYTTALEIVEHDALEAVTGKKEQPPKQTERPNNQTKQQPNKETTEQHKPITEGQIKKFQTVLGELLKVGGTKESVYTKLGEKMGISFASCKELSTDQASQAIKIMQDWIKKYTK